MRDYSYTANAHPDFIDQLYKDYRKNPESIDSEWKKFFEGFEFAGDSSISNGQLLSPKEFQVFSLILEYRRKAHLLSKTNPIRPRIDRQPNLDISYFGLSDSDLDASFEAGRMLLGLPQPSLRNILAELERMYCGSIGVEYTYITDAAPLAWIREEYESTMGKTAYSIDKKRRLLRKLNETVILEKFLHTKFIGQKRFSLEGGESAIPALDAMVEKGASLGVEEIVIGMAHRGRLNVLANIMGKTYEQLFTEFEGQVQPDTTMGDGDVKYHLGYSSLLPTESGKDVHVKLVPNPSHLEAVNPVVEGFARAKADLLYGSDFSRVLPVLIHGDAALPGQGVSYEVLQMSQLPGYHTGGTIHFVINNQIGFTTDFDDARSSHYCTSMASMVQAPVLHVNGDDVEAVVYCIELAVAFRQKFKRDVFIDMVCYRKHGHNESDEPKFTQPKFYKLIANHPNPREIYVQRLIAQGDITEAEAKALDTAFWSVLQERLEMAKQKPLPYKYQEPEQAWRALRKPTPEDFESSPETGIPEKQLKQIVEGLLRWPSDFKPLKKVEKLMEQKLEQFKSGYLDWSMGELAAYGSILWQGNHVRMSGQDVKRGTFSHRHAILYDEDTNTTYNRLSHLADNQGAFRIYNSLLSEFAVLGFEFGYSMASPDTLTIWEAQFGDFANGAQTMIDQFIASSESKWQRMSGLVMLLPHGYEGQGPEHSSARLERFLQLSAEYNMTVANVTTPANFFHLLRRQLERPFRKPLVVMSPKSLLRHPECISPISEFTQGGFQELMIDPASAKKVSKVLMCSGKIYYELKEALKASGRQDIVMVRLEQLFPLSQIRIKSLFEQYQGATFHWVQEEPANMGAWMYLLSQWRAYPVEVIARKPSASPATGYSLVHQREQQHILEQALA